MKKILFLVAVLVVSCTTTTKESNSSVDISKAKELTNNFYQNISNKEYIQILNMLDNKIKRENFIKVFSIKDSVLGKFENYQIDDVQTERNDVDGISKVVYKVVTKTQYEKKNANETITFTKDSTNNYKLSGYVYKSKL